MNLLDANDRPGRYPPGWYTETATPLPPFAPLRGAVRTEVCVVGGGYTGLSAAWHLVQAGFDVVLLEAQRVGFGASGRNGGQVGTGQRLDQDTLEKMVGRHDARRLWDMFEAAKRLVRHLADREEVQADWRDGVVHALRRVADVGREHAYVARLASNYGADRIEALDRTALAALIGTEVYAGGSVDWSTGHVHPLKLAIGLARLATQAGVQIHELSRVASVDETRVKTDTGEVTADHIVIAANGYLGGIVPQIARRVMPINNFMIATEPLGDAMPLSRPVAVADDRFVVNYWRPSDDGRLLFGGGESYGYRFPQNIAAKVHPRLSQVYPDLQRASITHAWGGTLAITRSRMPYFAALRPGLWTASGYSGHGVAMALMGGKIVADAIEGEAGRFDLMASLPSRPFPGGRAAQSPLLALAMTWYALRDRLGS